MTTSGVIKDYKKVLINKLVSSDETIAAMGNYDIQDNDEAVYKYIFPYFYIPYIIETAHSFICMKINMSGSSNRKNLFGNFTLYIWVIVNQEIMKMDGVGGATRLDHLSDIVESLFTNSNDFGVGDLKIISNTEEDLDMRHRCRKLVFSTSDIGEPLECE